jgi:hypothetical protein
MRGKTLRNTSACREESSFTWPFNILSNDNGRAQLNSKGNSSSLISVGHNI